MQRRQIWKYLIAIFSVFWIGFAVILLLGDIPLYIISIALTSVLVLAGLIVALAWGKQSIFKERTIHIKKGPAC